MDKKRKGGGKGGFDVCDQDTYPNWLYFPKFFKFYMFFFCFLRIFIEKKNVGKKLNRKANVENAWCTLAYLVNFAVIVKLFLIKWKMLQKSLMVVLRGYDLYKFVVFFIEHVVGINVNVNVNVSARACVWIKEERRDQYLYDVSYHQVYLKRSCPARLH